VEGEAQFPIVGVGLDWSQGDQWPTPALALWLTGVEGVEGVDTDVYLRPHEARPVVCELQARLDVLEVDRG